MMTFTIREKREAAERELKMRRRVYPRWVEQGRMTQQQADREIAIMSEIVADYLEQEKHELLV